MTWPDRHPALFAVLAVAVGIGLAVGEIALLSVSTWFLLLLPVLAAAAVIVAAIHTARGMRHHRQLTQRRAAELAEIARHADYEHRALMSGDLRVGMFGKYPPAGWDRTASGGA